MKISLEIDESKNEGKGETIISYQVGEEKFERQSSVSSGDVQVFNALLKIVLANLLHDEAESFKRSVRRMAETLNIIPEAPDAGR